MTAPNAGTPIPSAAERKTEDSKGDNQQLQASVRADDSPVRDYDKPPEQLIIQGEQQPPLDDRSVVTAALSPEERAKRKARLAVLLDRGLIQDRLSVPLPADKHGEWVRNDPLEIHRLETLGFEVDTKFANAHALHNDGSGAAVVGDVIFMITSRENKELIDEIRHEQFLASNNPRKSREEREFEEKVKGESGGDVPTFTESKTRGARKEQIAAALQEVDAQTKPTVITR